jgi:hypothetical protein
MHPYCQIKQNNIDASSLTHPPSASLKTTVGQSCYHKEMSERNRADSAFEREKMKKSFVGIVFLIFILLSAVTVFADTAETFWVNPAWLHQTDQKYLTPDQKSLRILSTTVCYSQQEVVSCLRENFRNRVTNFSFNMLYNYNVGDVGGILSQAVDEATANDDYLKFSIQAYNSRWSGYNGNVTVDYAVTFVSTASEEQQVTDRVDQILDSIITAGMNDEEKEKAIHDWVAANVAYDETLQEYSAWAALFLGYTVCQGYSLLTCRMLQESDVPVRIINSESMHHSWNMVNLCGYWYHLDVAWDDPVPDVPGRILYTYYNLSDQEISSGSDPHYNWTADAPDAPVSYVEGGCDNVFYEQYYLARNPDVARAVKSGVFGTGWEHFLACGESEGRSYNKPDAYGDFNEIYYLARNSDVARAVEKGIFGTGWDHFSACGEGEGRSYAKPDAYGDFNETYYLARNPDVARAVETGIFGTGWDHFFACGESEGRSYVKPDDYEGVAFGGLLP